MARYCHNCKTELSERAKFCRMCGTPSVLAVATEIANNDVPATEPVVRTPVVSAPDIEAASSPHPGTAKTEPALLGRLAAGRSVTGQTSERVLTPAVGAAPSQPIAPATHALVGNIFEQAGFALRFGAFMLDLLMLMSLLLATTLVAASLPRYSGLIQWSGLLVTLGYLGGNFFALASRNGQTLGKRLLGIRIITTDQRRVTMRHIVLRHLLGYPISLAVFALGFLWLLWDRRQQGWHDKLAGTIVVRKRFNW
ncbi:MAG: RDD family protein [Acidobacteriota bacterium]